jgi:release factor glutamine methyltransferase
MNQTKTWILAHPEAGLSALEWAAFQGFCGAYLQGTALPHILGSWEFYGRSFAVNEDVLIPRPETELMVEHGIAILKKTPHGARVADIGAGSGCVGVTLAIEAPRVNITAIDISFEALTIARANADRYDVLERFAFVQADLLEPIQGTFDLVCANLPYIPTSELRRLDLAGREPRLALDGGPDGLVYIRKLLWSLEDRLAEGGRALIEIGAGQLEQTTSIAHEAGWEHIQVFKDIAGIDRLLDLGRGRENE